jgi:hypothetical protein
MLPHSIQFMGLAIVWIFSFACSDINFLSKEVGKGSRGSAASQVPIAESGSESHPSNDPSNDDADDAQKKRLVACEALFARQQNDFQSGFEGLMFRRLPSRLSFAAGRKACRSIGSEWDLINVAYVQQPLRQTLAIAEDLDSDNPSMAVCEDHGWSVDFKKSSEGAPQDYVIQQSGLRKTQPLDAGAHDVAHSIVCAKGAGDIHAPSAPTELCRAARESWQSMITKLDSMSKACTSDSDCRLFTYSNLSCPTGYYLSKPVIAEKELAMDTLDKIILAACLPQTVYCNREILLPRCHESICQGGENSLSQ